jgi:hypothetical protein
MPVRRVLSVALLKGPESNRWHVRNLMRVKLAAASVNVPPISGNCTLPAGGSTCSGPTHQLGMGGGANVHVYTKEVEAII